MFEIVLYIRTPHTEEIILKAKSVGEAKRLLSSAWVDNPTAFIGFIRHHLSPDSCRVLPAWTLRRSVSPTIQ